MSAQPSSTPVELTQYDAIRLEGIRLTVQLMFRPQASNLQVRVMLKARDPATGPNGAPFNVTGGVVTTLESTGHCFVTFDNCTSLVVGDAYEFFATVTQEGDGNSGIRFEELRNVSLRHCIVQ